MNATLKVIQAGPSVLIQDMGRPGYIGVGLSMGGAADRLALSEGAAILGQDVGCAALELGGFGGVFEATTHLRFALTGAPMQADIDGQPVLRNSSHDLWPGQCLTIGAARAGVYGYLHLGGGLNTPQILGSRSAHLGAGIGKPVVAGDFLDVGPDDRLEQTGFVLDIADRFAGGTVRMVESAQTRQFADAELKRFQTVAFRRDPRGNRQGVRLAAEGAPFAVEAGLKILSEVIVPGDIQITGDGAPYVLLSECQTTGGYPRIGTVIPEDLPLVAQTAPGTVLRFELIGLDAALKAHKAAREEMAGLARRVRPLIRDPHDISDLLAYQLISGATAGDDPL
ncbi:MAG: urea amidolyase [Paracoccaceae bacterium]